MDGGKPREKQPKAEKPKDDDKLEVVDPDKEEIKPVDTNGRPEEQKPVKAVELRNAYEGLKKKVKDEYEPQAKELSTLRAKVKEFESRDETTTKATQEEIAAVKKRNAELEHHIRFADYKQTKDYKELVATRDETWTTAMRKISGIKISWEDREKNEVVERDLTTDDFLRYASLDPKLMWSQLKQEIPDAAERTTVINHVHKFQDVADNVLKAEKQAEADSETHAKTQTEAQQQSQQARAKFWKESNESLATKYPKWFAKADDDAEGNTLFDRGTALADLAFNPTDLTPDRIAMLPKSFKAQIESGKPFTQGQLTQLHSIVRNKAANHDRLVHQNKALTARLEEVEKSLKEYEISGPDNVPAGDGTRPTNGVHDPGTELEAISRKYA